MDTKVIIITENEVNQRIDKVLGSKFDDLSRSYVQKLIKDGFVLVNGKTVKVKYACSINDEISIQIPEAVELNLEPENIPLDIIYEDDDLLIINKPKGMVVHPAPGHYTGTMVNALLYHRKDSLSGINGVNRPGIVHRIDKDTSGSVMVCKNDFTHKIIAAQLKDHSIVRKYRAIVHGNFKDMEGTIDQPIGRHPNDRKKMSVHAKINKHAITHYRVLESFPGYSYIECQLETGRTHQIRVHMASIGHPLVGDEVYGIKEKRNFHTNGQTLHAMVLGFIHPRTNEYIETISELPEYFEKILKIMRK